MKTSGRKFDIISKTPKPFKALEIAFEIDLASVKHSKGKGVFQNDETKEFYRQLAKNNPSNIIVSLIYIDEKPVSYLIGFMHNNIHSGSQKAYLSGYEYFSLGKLGIIYLIDSLRNIDSIKFELGKGYDQFKKDFTLDYDQLFNIIITRNKFLQLYITIIYSLKTNIYPLISANPRLYKLYQRIKSLFTRLT